MNTETKTTTASTATEALEQIAAAAGDVRPGQLREEPDGTRWRILKPESIGFRIQLLASGDEAWAPTDEIEKWSLAPNPLITTGGAGEGGGERVVPCRECGIATVPESQVPWGVSWTCDGCAAIAKAKGCAA